MTFRHVDATFPKYFMRTYGPQAPWKTAGGWLGGCWVTRVTTKAPFEIILAINPIVEMIGTPLMTGLLLSLG